MALGDSSYEYFCQCGVNLDNRLSELGAKKLCARQDCDLDYEKGYLAWRGELDKALAVFLPNEKTVELLVSSQFASATSYNQKNPFQAEVLEKINLCDRGSSKTTYHLELSLEGSQLNYKPGDSLGVYPSNSPGEVDSIIKYLDLDSDSLVQVDDKEVGLREAILSTLEISRVTLPVFSELCNYTRTELKVDKNDRKMVHSYLEGKSLMHVLQDLHIPSIDAQILVSTLRKMPHRLYSIASSLLARPDEAHLLVTLAQINGSDQTRLGVFSNHCHNELAVGDKIPIFLHENTSFKLNYDALDKPIIMVGPGTGLAPFRAFMEEREELGATGLSWLFFGECHMFTDFYYQTEWQTRLSSGSLSKMDVAFSRDQANKIYVQHRMRENQATLFDWIDSKEAIIYVCGDADGMAKEVHQTLIEIVAEQKKCSLDLANEYVEDLVVDNRYLRDVY